MNSNIKYEEKVGKSISKARGKYFHQKYEQNTSGFWLNKEQLQRLLDKLHDNQGLGFMVGAHPLNENQSEDWFGVEVVILKGDFKKID